MSRAKTTSIKFTSRASLKLGDSFYTFEACIEKSIPEDVTEEEYSAIKDELWGELNNEVDNQAVEIANLIKRK